MDFRQVSRVDELTDSLMSGITSCLSWLAATIRFARQQQNATRFLLSNCFPATRHSGLHGATFFKKSYTPRDTRAQAARTLQVQTFELGPKN